MNWIKNHKKWVGAILLLAVLIAYFLLKPQPQPSYITAQPKTADIENTVLATGSINAFKQVTVGAQVSGQIKTLYVKLGQQVKKGEPIADIDNVSQQNSLKDTQASLLSYEAQLVSLQVSLAKAQLTQQRQEKLLALKATSQEDYDNAKVNLAEAVANIGQMKANINKAKLAVNTAQQNLSYTKIVSPIDGVIVVLAVDEGQTVNAMQAAPTIVKIAQLDKVTIKAEIAEGDVVKIKPGLPLYFSILGKPDKVYHATLRSIDPGPQALSDNTSTTGTSSSSSSSTATAIYYYALFDVDNPQQELRISMTAQTTIVLEGAKNVLSIPSSALLDVKNNKAKVKTLQNNQIVEKSIEIGLNNGVLTEIKSGLTEQDTVVLGTAAPGAATSGPMQRPPPRM